MLKIVHPLGISGLGLLLLLFFFAGSPNATQACSCVDGLERFAPRLVEVTENGTPVSDVSEYGGFRVEMTAGDKGYRFRAYSFDSVYGNREFVGVFGESPW